MRTVLDGSLRLLGRWRQARMRWKAEVAYFPVNVVKCCEIPGNVVKKSKMLWNVVKIDFTTFHNISQHFGPLRKIRPQLAPGTSKNVNFSPRTTERMDFCGKVCTQFFLSVRWMLWNLELAKNAQFWGSERAREGISQHFRVFTTFHNIPMVFTTLQETRKSAAESRDRALSIAPGLVW